MKISMDKKYKTKSGLPVRILCIDRGGFSPVISILGKRQYIHAWSKEGISCNPNLNLVEVSPYDDFKIDDKVLVWNIDGDLTRKGHFAGLDDFGYPTTWTAGATSFTTNGDRFSWRFCKKYESSDI